MYLLQDHNWMFEERYQWCVSQSGLFPTVFANYITIGIDGINIFVPHNAERETWLTSNYNWLGNTQGILKNLYWPVIFSSILFGLKRLGCHADLKTVRRCHTRDESEDHIGEKTCNPEQTSPEVQKRVSVAPQKKDLCSPKIKNKLGKLH